MGLGGTVGGGPANAIGTFTVNNTIALTNGNVFVRVDKSLAQSNDMIVATGIIANDGAGTVTVTNIGATALSAGDTFRVFNKAVGNGAALAVTGEGMGWANNLAVDGSIQAVSAIVGYPTNISYSFGGGTLTLTWPATHLGWTLQVNTNSLALTDQWYDIPSTANLTSMSVAVNPADPVAFYRLRR